MEKRGSLKIRQVRQFQNKLLEWYDHNARILPWRDDPSPYRVWISEIMLQQTRVETVKPYFENFMREVPTLRDLGDIPDDKLLKLWEGLGYYSRARNLKKAANIISQKFGGEMPCKADSLKTLPGVGPYSAGAIASIAYGEKVPAIDGNVLRVMARVTADKGDIANRIVRKEIEELVKKILPTVRVGDFNQALMELGATVCLPSGEPKCAQCPVNFLCEGYRQGIAETLPVKAKKPAKKVEQRTVYIINSGNRIALRQRPNTGLLANLWEFPQEKGHLSPKECEVLLKEWGISASRIIPLKESKHIFTHLEWQMIGYFILTEGFQESAGFIWATRDEIKKQYPIPSAFKAYFKYLN